MKLSFSYGILQSMCRNFVLIITWIKSVATMKIGVDETNNHNISTPELNTNI